MCNFVIKGFVSNLDTREFKNGIKSNFIINGIKCVSWNKTIAHHLKNGMEVEILEYSIKTETWEKDDKKYYLDNRVVVERLKLLGQYQERDFVGIGNQMSSQEIDKYNQEFKKPIEKKEANQVLKNIWGNQWQEQKPNDEDDDNWELDM